MKQLCKSCGKTTEHNESGKRENPPRSPRCTFCGHPVKTGLARPYWEAIRDQQVKKAGRG